MTFGPIFCPAECCGGPFDFYGQIYATSLHNDLLYRTGSAVPAGEDEDTYTSIDEGWSVDYSADADDQARIAFAIAAMVTDEEIVWPVRSGNEDHPEASFGDNIAAAVQDWSEGADADYDPDEDLLAVTTDDATADAYFEDGVSLADGKSYRASIVAKAGAVEYVEVTVTEINAAHDSRTMLLNLTANSGTNVDDSTELDDDYWEYATIFTAATPPGGAVFRVRLCSSIGGDVDADDGDGAYISSASLVPLDGGNPGWDIACIDAEHETIELHEYLRRSIVIDASNSRKSGISEEYIASNGVVSRRAKALTGTYEEWDAGEERLKVADWSHGSLIRMWGSDDAFGLIALQGAEAGADNYDASDVLSVFKRTLPDTRHIWGVSGWLNEAEYPSLEYGDWSGTYPCEYFDATTINGGENFARIVACPPHGYPNVFGILQPRRLYYTDSTTCPWDPGNAGPYGPPPANWIKEYSVSQTAAITYGSWGRTYVEVLTDVGEPPFDVVRRTLPFLHGSNTVWWSDTLSQTRLVYFAAGMEDERTGFGVHGTSHVWCTLLMADSYGNTTSAAGGIFVHGRATITIDDSGGAAPWESWNDAGVGPVEDVTTETWLKVKLGGTVVFDHEIWRDAQAPWEGLLSAECMVHGVTAIQATEDDQDVNVRWVWFEALFSTAPTSSVTGVRSGWRMHVADAAGADEWTLDNDVPGDTPECYAASDRYFYARGFTFCDSRIDDNRADEWMFTHDGAYMWPVRKIVDGALDEELSTTKFSGNAMACDMIKNSDRLPLCPAYDAYPDRADVNFVDELLPALDDSLCGATASYDTGSDRFSVDVDTETTTAEVASGVVFDHRLWHRFILEATADEVTWLLVRFEDFGGVGSHLSAWLNVGAGSFGATSGVRTSPTKSAVDLGDGRYRFIFYAEVSGSSNVSSTVVVRLVDGNSDENLDAAAVDDGLALHSWSLSSDCAEFAP